MKAVTLSGEGKQLLMAAFFCISSGNAVVQDPAIEVPVYDLLQIGPPEAVLTRKMLIIDPDEGLKIVLHAAAIIG